MAASDWPRTFLQPGYFYLALKEAAEIFPTTSHYILTTKVFLFKSFAAYSSVSYIATNHRPLSITNIIYTLCKVHKGL